MQLQLKISTNVALVDQSLSLTVSICLIDDVCKNLAVHFMSAKYCIGF
jgi:hypothetical protein